MNQFIQLLSKPYITIGASLTRIGFGLLLLYFYGIHYAQRGYLWGPNGVIDFELFQSTMIDYNSFSLYGLSASPLFFEIIFHLGLIFAFLYTIGFKGRFTSIVNFILVFSIHERNHLILDGGDNVMRIILFYLIFAQTTRFFSVDSYRRQITDREVKTSFVSSSLHNLAILAAVMQLCIMYLNSALYKVMGEVWQNGTAVYYTLQVEEYSLPFFRNIINSSDLIIALVTYGTVIVQISFPFLLFNKRTKYFSLILVVGMHIGIGIVMGLFTFSITMIVIDLLLISNKDYIKAFSFIRSKIKNIKFSKKRSSKDEGTVSEG
ncbi:HTTM domain-containing protein [Viridibacillus sp. YIM B01967]|uniref:HTTM domain-containing protein n=1 Tax=Viridibacillus soli TaxID=2798301 RepID=A0ABS1HCY1_9BACL|nr:HTTM domain-containing protein [Viridibacillus soli]MBK3497196.1 HTTM domain-containing protein [Viridibacillus soli]